MASESSMKTRNNEEWKSGSENKGTGNNITIKSEELKVDPITTTTFSGTINLKVNEKPQPVINFKKLLRLKHDQNHEEKS
jgi:hypothetical protein